MTTSYFKVTRWDERKILFEHVEFFDGTSAQSVVDAYTRAMNISMVDGGMLSMWKAPEMRGAWSLVPLVGVLPGELIS